MHNPNIVFTSPRVAEVTDKPVPSPEAGDVLVRTVRSCLSAGVMFDAAALTHIAIMPMQALRKCRFEFGESVLVMGQGILGQLAVKVARAAYASLFARIYALMKEGRQSDDPALADAYAKYLYMCNLGDTFGDTDDTMRGPHLYVLQKLGVFRNRLTRDGSGILTDYAMSDAEKREVEERMRCCGLLPEEEQ